MTLSALDLLTAICFVSSAVGQTPGPQELANLDVSVCTTSGVAIDGARVALIGVGPKQTFQMTGGVARFKKIPYGLYDLEVQLVGFKVRRERIGVYQPDLAFRVGIDVGYPSLHERPELMGSIKPAPKHRSGMWIRLVPVYAGSLIENTVDSNGQFKIVGLSPGKYVLLLFNGEDLVTAQSIDFKGGSQSADITVADPGTAQLNWNSRPALN